MGVWQFRPWRAANGRFLRFRSSRTFSTLRSGSRNQPFSLHHEQNSHTPMRKVLMTMLSLALAACSGAKPEVPQLALQPILYFDVTQNKLYGSSCNFVPVNGGMGAVFLAMETRGLIKIDDHIVAIPVAADAAALPQGAHSHYTGPLYAATLTPVVGGKHKTMGVVGVFDGHLVITDAKGKKVYDAVGDTQCKPM